MFVTIINDCQDDNAAARQLTRAAHLFGVTPSFVGVESYKELQAAGNLIDMLDAAEAGEGVIMVNVAPRHGHAKQWPNGTPFCYFYVGKTLIVSTIDGLTLSLVKKLKLATAVRHIDLEATTEHMVRDGELNEKQRGHIVKTQFRSFDYLPRVAHYLWDYDEKLGEEIPFTRLADASPAVWWVDNFGNCKTTLLAEEFAHQEYIATQHGQLRLYPQLKDVPDKEAAFVVGSSGFGEHRFLEIVVQGERADQRFGLWAGDLLIMEAM